MKKVTKKVIAVDADEVLAAFIDHFLVHYNAKYQTVVSKDKIHSFKLDPIFNTTQDVFLKRMDEYYESGEVLKIKPVKGSLKGVDQLLRKGYFLEIITARPSMYKEATINWVNQHFPKRFNQIHFSFNPYNKNSEDITKAEICKRIGAKVLIDDNIVNAFDCAKNGIKVFLMDMPWNQVEDLPEGIIRVKSWEEIIKKL
jgi:5'(3')-deoxyribonucleotidase